MDYIFTKENKGLGSTEIWNKIGSNLKLGAKIKSIKGVEYTIQSVKDDKVGFSATSRNKGENEEIGKDDFLIVIEKLKKEREFNTSSSREYFPSRIYKKRSPLFAILLATHIIELKNKFK